MITILGIESSCDDTSAAVIRDGVLLSNVTASQAVHEAYGGVVPELASRAHQQNIVPVVDQALKQAGVAREELSAVAFTRGPGLMGSLLVGVSFAKGLAASLGIPMIEVNHLQGHILAHFVREQGDDHLAPQFPFLCLLVSGGNSQIVLVRAYNDMEIIGRTIDDAAGEAIDKCSKVMGLGYPGGPVIDRLARRGNTHAYEFARPQIAGYDYFYRPSQGGSGSKPRVYDCGYTDEETVQGGQGPEDKTGGRGRRCECEYGLARGVPGSCQTLWVEGVHPQVRLYYRQCCHDSYGGLF